MSAVPEEQHGTTTDLVAGVLASASIFVGAIGAVVAPVRVIPFTVVLALVAAAMSDRHRTLAAWAVGLSMVFWLLGMTAAILTDNPLY